jgi:hypothetical protein
VSLDPRDWGPDPDFIGPDQIPDTLYVLSLNNLESAAGMWIPQWGMTGLAVFTSEHSAYAFGEWLPNEDGLEAHGVTLEKANRLLEQDHLTRPVLLLLDAIDAPRVIRSGTDGP